MTCFDSEIEISIHKFYLFSYIVSNIVDVFVAGYKVTEANGHEADEAKVSPVHVVPTLPGGKEHCAKDDVANQDKEASGDRDGDQPQVLHQLELHHLLLLLLFLLILLDRLVGQLPEQLAGTALRALLLLLADLSVRWERGRS